MIAVGMVVGALGLAGCSDGEASKAASAQARPVMVARVHYAPLVEPRGFVATVRARVESPLAFQIGGKVVRRLVEVGQHVETAAMLAILDDKDLRLQQEQAEAEVRAARVAFDQAAVEQRRGRQLRGAGWVPQAVLDKLTAATEEARSRLTRGERALELTHNALGHAVLTADATGVVTATLVEPGEVVTAGRPVIQLAHDGDREAVIAVPESLIGQLAEGQASMVLWPKPGKSYALRLRELSPAADPVTRTYAARYTVLDVDSDVVLGMSATVTIAGSPSVPLARLPLGALFDRGAGSAVWTVAADGGLTLSPVDVARYDGTSVYVRGGVEEGDSVVALGVHKLDAGQKVRVINRPGV
ncbi:multidrug transporter [Azospirillum brasilense]|nr:multidrug transporter [Azospirillum brasilense]